MDLDATDVSRTLSRQEASDAVVDLGWRHVLGMLRTSVGVTSLAQAAQVAGIAVTQAGPAADEHLLVDIRHDRAVLSVQWLPTGTITPVDVDLARRISAAVDGLGLRTESGVPRSVQVVEIGIDAMDIPAIRPFWAAALGYEDEPGAPGQTGALLDPFRQGVAVWFQQMDEPRPQRNRIHLDISVPHDEAPERIDRVLKAGGVLLSDAEAPAFWVFADPEGNEACVTTWQGRD
jgi:4a-hydroxytetrahydrobiopterin dehydratase